MNAIDELLADTASYLHSRLREDRVLREHLRAVLAQGQDPTISQLLGPEMPDAYCVVQIGAGVLRPPSEPGG